MLVLSRKVNESVDVAGDITIKVISVNGNCVKLGVTAPNSVRILRSELTVGMSDPVAADPSPASRPGPTGFAHVACLGGDPKELGFLCRV